MKRRRLYLFLIVSFFLSSYCFLADSNVFVYNSGSVGFTTKGPFGIIKASSKKLTGSLDGDKKIFTFSVPVASFEGFNNTLQKKHFNEKYMESAKIPSATFKGKIIEDIDYGTPGVHQVRAKGAMNIHGVDKEMIVKSKLTVKEGQIMVESEFNLLLQDFGIKVPTIVNQKVDDNIAVEVKLEMVPKK